MRIELTSCQQQRLQLKMTALRCPKFYIFGRKFFDNKKSFR